MFNVLRKPRCFLCKGKLGADYSEVRYGNIDETKGVVNICKECADVLDRSRSDADTI